MKSTLSSALSLEDEDRGRDAGAVEQVGRQADDRVQQVLLDQLLADAPLAAAAEEHAVRHDHAHAPVLSRLQVGALDHVADEGVVAHALGRHAAPEALVRSLAAFSAPHLSSEKGGLATPR
jgi:hypothetical protein